MNYEVGSVSILGGKGVIPLVSIQCMTCGNTKLLNAIALGLVDQATGRLIDG